MLYFTHTCYFIETDLKFGVVLNSSGKDTRKETGRRTLRSSKRGGNRETDCLGKNSSAYNSLCQVVQAIMLI